MLRENKLSIFANLLLVMLMSSSICQALYTSLFMTYKLSLTIFIAVIPLTLLFFVMFRNKVSTIVSAIVACIMLIIGLVFVLFNVGITNAVYWLSTYSIWFIDVANGYIDNPYFLYTNLTIFLLAFFTTLFIFIFSIKLYNFYVISIMLFSIFFIQLQFNIFLSKTSFVLFMLAFLLYYFFDVLGRRSKELTYDIGNKFKYLIYVIPVCILIIAASFLFPVKDTRSAVPWLDTKFDSIINSIVDRFSNNDFSNFDYFAISATGFGNDDRLGGNINLSKSRVMKVKSDYSNLYLKASSKDFYDGHGWYESNQQYIPLGKDLTSYSDEIKFDSDEFIIGLNMLTDAKKNDAIFKPAKAEIEFTDLKTKSLFIPAKANLLTFKDSISLFYDNEQMISSNQTQKNGFEYTVEYNNIILNSEEFKTNIRKSYKGYYNDNVPSELKDLQIILTENEKKDIQPDKTISLADSFTQNELLVNAADSEALKERADVIYRRYTQLPNTITARVRQLAKDITKDKTNIYDKTKAVETYLSKNYPYTLKPGNAPRKKDFVDYFLFDGKKGYCTYYASAMTVLLRCIDIPARYVEGYILPPETDENGVYNVTNQQAHAWVEVYFEGFGWIPFEPTAPFVDNMYSDKTSDVKISSDMLGSGYTDYMEMMEKYRNRNGSSSYDFSDWDTIAVSKSNTPLLVLIIISSVIGAIILAFAILILINILKLYRLLRKIRKSDPNSSILMAYTYILKVLGVQSIVFEPGETPSQFGIRMEKTFDFKSYSFNKTSFTKITNHYVDARYSKAILLKNDQQDMLDFIDVLVDFTIEKIGRFKFFIVRYVLGKM